ncbi:hypothetical protein AB0F03_37890 [Streptomyces sp. NPDC028722]|uniref:hypothetical protein n=1 Tax=Streptomyces sp. NPDC028722 TaxID=3155016 RepID=UPI0033E17392
MAIQITSVRLSGGTTHQHITRLWWTNPETTKSGDNTRAELVTWIQKRARRTRATRAGTGRRSPW